MKSSTRAIRVIGLLGVVVSAWLMVNARRGGAFSPSHFILATGLFGIMALAATTTEPEPVGGWRPVLRMGFACSVLAAATYNLVR